MNTILQNIDWAQLIYTIWTVVLLPVLTYAGTQLSHYAKSKRLEQYTDILYKNVISVVKELYECIVKDIKGTENWTKEKQNEIKELAKTKVIQALTTSVYQMLKSANEDFDEYLDSLIGTALYDLKNEK